ncbi:MAG: hypothetical protein HKN01_09640, partial [Acidimicrobiia bacterium]|nr:hypothetical protein [Acidimicrobiia bacterium]
MSAASVARRLLIVVLVVTGCTDAAVSETTLRTTTTTTSTTTSTTTTTTTTLPPIELDLVVGITERLALGGDIAIRAEAGGESVDLTADTPEGTLVFAEPATVQFTYMLGSNQTDITWSVDIARSGAIEVTQPWREPAVAGDPVALVWQARGDTNSYLAQLDRTRNVTVTSPVCMFVGSTGTLTNGCSRTFVRAAQDRGYAVWPAIAGLDADANAIWLNDPDIRSAAAVEIAGWIDDLGADGINLDIEGYREDTANSFVAFVEELTPLIHAGGGEVSIDIIPRTDDWVVTPDELSFWSTAPRRRELADLADYLVLMAYDEHNRFRP